MPRYNSLTQNSILLAAAEESCVIYYNKLSTLLLMAEFNVVDHKEASVLRTLFQNQLKLLTGA